MAHTKISATLLRGHLFFEFGHAAHVGLIDDDISAVAIDARHALPVELLAALGGNDGLRDKGLIHALIELIVVIKGLI